MGGLDYGLLEKLFIKLPRVFKESHERIRRLHVAATKADHHFRVLYHATRKLTLQLLEIKNLPVAGVIQSVEVQPIF